MLRSRTDFAGFDSMQLKIVLLGIAIGLAGLCAQDRGADKAQSEVRFLCFSPSPYTNRHDTLRAGLGIHILLEKLSTEKKLPLRTRFFDGSAVLDSQEKCRALVHGADVVVVGSSTWSQGSTYYIRRFFEVAGGESLDGVSVSAWTTAGGFHTGGEMVVIDTLRSLMGMGGLGFTLFQKLMVFSVEERQGVRAGDFTLLDCWYMDQFARRIAAVALARGNREKAAEIARDVGSVAVYYHATPGDDELARTYANLQKALNSAGNPRSQAYQELIARMSR